MTKLNNAYKTIGEVVKILEKVNPLCPKISIKISTVDPVPTPSSI